MNPRTILKHFAAVVFLFAALVAVLMTGGCATIPPEYVIKQNDALTRAQSHIKERNAYDEMNDVQPRVAERRQQLFTSFVANSSDELKRVASGDMTMEAYTRRLLEEAEQDKLSVQKYEQDLRKPITDGDLAIQELENMKKENIELAKKFQPLTLN